MADEEAKAEAFGVTSGNTTTFSQLLFSADEKDPIFNSNLKMICFGMKEESILLSEPSSKNPPQSSGITCSDSSSLSSGIKSNSKLKKRNGLEELDQENDAIKVAQKASKKIKADSSGSAVHAKRKEKLGERITALQQLVSPFGKTDTASVLHEAMGYIKFLQEQVHVLCSPYLQNLPITSATGRKEREREEEGKSKKKELSLRSRGLCLIPVECSLHLANCNVADFWSPLMGKKL